MGATGGDTTQNGLDRIQEKVLTRNPDLVLVGFGMNDHNVAPFGITTDQFEANLRKIVSLIKSKTDADVLVLSTFPPNPDWAFGSHQMDKYAKITQKVAAELNVAYADVYSVWLNVLARKDPSSLLGNNINHPNNFGHWLYFQALEAVEF
jgi:acyl-CoA thioesterase-1